MDTVHLGDCMAACVKCMDNYHAQFINTACDTCYTIIKEPALTKWEQYKRALATGEINAETYAILTADLDRAAVI